MKGYSLVALQIALSHAHGKGGGANVNLGMGTVTKAHLERYVSFLGEHRDWREERRFCWLILFTGLTAVFTFAIAVGTWLLIA